MSRRFPFFVFLSFGLAYGVGDASAVGTLSTSTASFAVSASSANVEAAAKWAQFLTSSETAADVRVSAGWELPALNEPSYFTDYLKQTPPDNRQAVFDSLEGAVVPPVIARQSEMQDAVSNLLGQVADGTLTSQDALDQAKAQLDELLKPA